RGANPDRHRRGGDRRRRPRLPGTRRSCNRCGRAGRRWAHSLDKGESEMIVRDLGDAWQIVLQTDHADLSAAFARAWKTPLPPALATAIQRHGAGWAVWEQSPRVDADGKPVNFLEVDIRSHLAFYRAGIAAITEEDPDAGLLVAMHGAGIYRQR